MYQFCNYIVILYCFGFMYLRLSLKSNTVWWVDSGQTALPDKIRIIDRQIWRGLPKWVTSRIKEHSWKRAGKRSKSGGGARNRWARRKQFYAFGIKQPAAYQHLILFIWRWKTKDDHDDGCTVKLERGWAEVEFVHPSRQSRRECKICCQRCKFLHFH